MKQNAWGWPARRTNVGGTPQRMYATTFGGAGASVLWARSADGGRRTADGGWRTADGGPADHRPPLLREYPLALRSRTSYLLVALVRRSRGEAVLGLLSLQVATGGTAETSRFVTLLRYHHAGPGARIPSLLVR